jgi:hypothetical protein
VALPVSRGLRPLQLVMKGRGRKGGGLNAAPSVFCSASSRKLERGARPLLLNLARQPGAVHHL